ncbi:flagellar hook-associated protein FlgK [Acidithiobacillus caldus]|jgi:flagellar hook-associated protein 1 FlgK|uniref:Flagellar hook-associated protein 1 n=3 Tax=Acidithiobacillus caldus TaxID=33059 RepID=F9ZN76_ACICS|nr:flagellar hook-associated protein FlgK [Acidithiobacillus caldus]AEK58119.1 Flagellar hook-associated protein flgK [Acidithiobacillus caldus SM-1]AIA55109.1 Flagellar hook-associated protein FlgK [Acidithiobacillus caldus ATCC 51756]AUW32763.1 flagellar hook-associated protein FlgK [Acidithiobacillus caldus]MBU2730271.1 flagellar hook-associated protein FlgK [Acidithiobacillus caldus]MBU2734344.1 flagellar hook-associated protein FlgK [Acidithiobacillus caldus ATCC 51756]
MSGVSGILSSALSGLQVAQDALQVTGNNIANVNTPGYSQESVVQSSLPTTFLGGQYYGNGAQVSSVQRAYSSFLQSQVWSATAQASGQSTLSTSLQGLLGTLSGGAIASSINQFFSGAAQVAASPESVPARQALLSNAQSLSQTFNSLAQQLDFINTGVNQQISQSVQEINTLSNGIAQLNSQIASLQGQGNGNPNSLLDQRDQLITELNAQVGVQVLPQSGGQVNVYLSNGQVLVADSKAFSLQTQPNPYDGQSLNVGYLGPNGGPGADISTGLSGGVLGGLLQFRSQSLIPAQNGLGLLADGLAASVNAQQAQGLDLNGNPGAPLFQLGGVQIFAHQGNTGSASVSGQIRDVAALTADNYIVSYQGSGQWSVQDQSTGQILSSYSGSGTPPSGTFSVQSSGGAQVLSFAGVQVSVSGNPGNGDRFLVEPTHLGAVSLQTVLSNPAQIAAASPYVSSPGELVNGALQNANLGNLTLSSGSYVSTAPSGSTVVSGLASFPTPLQITLSSGGSSGSSVSYVVSSGSGTSSGVIATGSVTLGGSGSFIDIAYPGTPGGYWQVNLSGSMAASGDAFTLSPGGPGSNGNAAALAALGTDSILGNGQSTFNDQTAQLLTQVTTQAQQAQSNAQAQGNLLSQAQAAQQSVSGVNLDQEAANLIQYQQAYQAAAKAISVGNSLFQSLLQAL